MLAECRLRPGRLACAALLATLLLPGETRGSDCPMPFVRLARDSGVVFKHERGGAGLKQNPETMGSGVAWLDYDGDGRLDLYVVQSGEFPSGSRERTPNRLFRQVAGGRFEDRTQDAGTAGPPAYGQGVVVADVDGNGHPDLFLTNYGADALLLNRGDGTFEDATGRWGAGVAAWSASAAFADADLDGDLDLYASRYLVFDAADPIYCGDAEKGTRTFCGPDMFEGERDVYLRNEGDRFTDQTESAGFGSATGKALGVLFSDLDGDGDPDVYVANDLTPNLLFQNRGDGTFEDVSLISGAAMNAEGREEAGMGVALGDVTGDLLPEIAVSNYDVETNTLYRNRGAMVFEDISAVSGLGVPSFNLLGFGMALADLDLDGRLDLYVANGHVREEPERENVGYAQRDLLLAGLGGGRFAEVRCAWLETEPKVGRGLAMGDYDDDGDPDLAIQNSGGDLDLLRNEAEGGGWLGLVLHGRGANTAAVGARVLLETASGERQVRWVMAGDSYLSSSDSRPLFGLGSSEVERLEIRWPSGNRTTIARPPLRRYLQVWEP